MDAVYQAVKSFLKSFVNLFVAVIELFAGLINLLASLLAKPFTKQTAADKEGASVLPFGYRKENFDVTLVARVRSELQQKITGKDDYIWEKASVEALAGSIIMGRKKRLYLAVKKALLEEEFKDIFLTDQAAEEVVTETRISSICEVSKEATG